MADLKKKFIDILFEDDEDDQELLDDSYEEVVKKPIEKEETTIRAKDILYRKSDTSPFVNLTETPLRKEETLEAKKNEYEMSAQISPIFGVINDNKEKEVKVNKKVDDSLTSKPLDSHLDIITSPIYGYGSNQGYLNDVDDNYIETTIDDEIELHHLFDYDEPVMQEEVSDANYDEDEEISLFRLFGDNK